MSNQLKNNTKEDPSTLRTLGVAYFEIGDFTEALSYYDKALKINRETDNKSITARCLLNIGNVHLSNGNYPVAIDYHNRSLKISESISDTLMISFSLNNLGLIYRNLEDYEKAITFSEKALEIQKKIGNKKGVAETLNSLGLLYIQIKDHEKAKTTLKEALAISQDINSKYIEGFTLNNIGYAYLNSKNYEKSLEYYKKAKKTNLDINGKRALTVSYYGLAKALTQKREFQKALPNALKSLQFSQDLNMSGFEKDIQELLSTIYQNIGNYKEALSSHQHYKRLNDSIFNKKNIEKIAQIESEYKYQKALDSASIRELKLTEQVTATSRDLAKSQQNYLWAIIGVLLVSIILGSTAFFQKFKSIKVKNQTIATEQKLLRSQMTPHFIFNSLSVLQGMILNKEEKKSVSYLSKFSKLMRITLENSRDKLVLLSQELLAVDNYLSLQNLENEAYQFSISVDDNIDSKVFLVPPMLIQPFVENAIAHAFKIEQEIKTIAIHLNYSNKNLICTITDNGIGVNTKKEIKSGDKTSLATAITSERVKLLSKDLKVKGWVTIEDRRKYDAQGTLVTLVIPHKIIEA
ncbi:tetratricopeptide repeat protein [Hyunsoonleella sp. SJ7]|uniref:Tetratricopeptide repeat protein n=1 Tax=Hyunsoonleella aquatilis TaxID=2762758 RepID=A0A923HD60_9FLAO|nr:tetratricopeptide repeat protein [Hyunsoonleella aquatilis]